jgi:peptide/nickel transport system substrate-binding protein
MQKRVGVSGSSWIPRRLLAPIVAATALVSTGFLATRPGWGQVASTGSPAAEDVTHDLLRSPPFDRITLNDGSVVLVEPISPRPLPPYDPKKDKRSEYQRPKTGTEGLIRVGDSSRPEPQVTIRGSKRSKVAESGKPDEDVDPNNFIIVHLLRGQGKADLRDFKVRRALIKKIDYFEDLLLAESDRLNAEKQFARAFEALLFLKARAPGWPGRLEALSRLLFSEGTTALKQGEFDRGVRLLRELLEKNKDYPGLVDQLATAYTQRIEKALELGAFARGRVFLHQFENIAPKHAKYLASRDLFVNAARRKLDEARAGKGTNRLDLTIEALRIWPALEEAASLFEQAFNEVPTLDVGVLDVPSPPGPWIRSAADARTTRLLYRPLLAEDDSDSSQGKSPGQLAAQLDATDLGRGSKFDSARGLSGRSARGRCPRSTSPDR